jgi:hypothetical protein
MVFATMARIRDNAPEFTPGKTALIVIFAIAFAAIESAVVHYLHMLYFPGGFSFPLPEWDEHFIAVEAGREVATVIVMFTVAYLAHHRWWGRFAWFMLIFGVWDIFYYIWLVVFENWPESLFTVDLLFMIPVPWAGPVISPVVVSVGLIVSGVLLLIGLDLGRPGPSKQAWSLTLAGWLVILAAFMWEAPCILETNDAGPFNWWMFATGMLVWVVGVGSYLGMKAPHPADRS